MSLLIYRSLSHELLSNRLPFLESDRVILHSTHNATPEFHRQSPESCILPPHFLCQQSRRCGGTIEVLIIGLFRVNEIHNQKLDVASPALIHELEWYQATVEALGICNDTTPAEMDVSHMLDYRITLASTVHFWCPGRLLNVICRKQRLFDVYTFAKRYLGRTLVECAVDGKSCRADAFVPLTLDMPFLPLLTSTLRIETDLLDLKDHL